MSPPARSATAPVPAFRKPRTRYDGDAGVVLRAMYDHHPSDADLLLKLAAQNAELRELLTVVAQELERLAALYPEHAATLLARAQRLRSRLWTMPAGGTV